MPASHLQLKLQVPLSNPARPFIKWVGGKRRVIPEIIRSMPERFEAYYEPFIGGGALFFHLRSLNILQDNLTTIADLNLRLIRTYLAIRDDVGAVIDRLEHHRAHNSKEYFYDLRGTNIDACTKNADVAAWFIYLNKTAFNGLYRVNKKNGFNAPWGRYKNPNICDTENLLACNMALQNVRIIHGQYDSTVADAVAGDFVYFDPPYVPVSSTASFTAYTKSGFGPLQQVLLRDCALELKSRGVQVLLSNSDHPTIHEWYSDFDVRLITVGRAINCKGDQRGGVGEVLIR